MAMGRQAWGPLLLTVATVLTLPVRLPGCCGSHIVGGHEVKPHSRPYMVSVSFEGQHPCAGFLLQTRWVVSAAHCFTDRDISTGLVVLGAHALKVLEPTRQVFGIAAIILHPSYQPATYANDLCLLRLNGSAVLGPAVSLLRLPRRGAKPPLAGTQCRVAGWGFVSDLEEPPGADGDRGARTGPYGLQQLLAGPAEPSDALYPQWGPPAEGFLLIGFRGPLVCGSRAHGLVSFSGLWCGDPRTPDVYTQVSAFVAWIWGVVRAAPLHHPIHPDLE